MNNRRVLFLALGFIPFVVLATLNSAGYRYGASDQAFYVPAVLDRLDPAHFPRDSELIHSQSRLTLVDETIATLARTTHASLPTLFLTLYVVALGIVALGATQVSSILYRTPWATVGLLAALTMRHAIAKTGTNTLEGYFHPRQLAFGLGVVALASFLRGGYVSALLLVVAGGLVHPTTALWFLVWLGVAICIAEPRWRVPLGGMAILAGVAGIWALAAGPLAGRLASMDAAWLATLVNKDYLFPLAWPASAWLLNLLYVPVIVWIFSRRQAAGLIVPREGAAVVGCLSLAGVFALALPLQAREIAISIQLQPARVFWMLDFLAIVYVVWALAEGIKARERRAVLVAATLGTLSAVRGGYVATVRFPERQPAEIRIPDTDWGRAMAWVRQTDLGSGWIADPGHASRYGTSLRVAGERDVLVEDIKDTAIGMYDRRIALRTRERLEAVGSFAQLTPSRARELGARYGLDYLVTEQSLTLPIVFSSGALKIYRID